MKKIELEKLLIGILKYSQRHGEYVQISDVEMAIKDQALEYKDGKIVEIKQESKDEKIRKEIIEFVDINTLSVDERHDRWIAWLEKQGQTFTKKDVDDAYLKGISDAKNELEKQGEQKPAAWSKDDEEMFQSCTRAIWAADYYLYEDKQDMEVWLKSIKNRIGG